MINEAHLKLHIIREARDLGYYARRLEHQYLVGLPDLFMKSPESDWLWIEVKYLVNETHTPNYTNKMSSPQRRQLRKMANVNAKAYLLSIWKKETSYILRFSDEFELDRISKGKGLTFEKIRGKKWPVRDFMLALG